MRPAGRRLSTNADIEALRADGALTGRQTHQLVQLKELCDALRHAYIDVDGLRCLRSLPDRLCDALRHAYIDVEADEVHAAVLSTLRVEGGHGEAVGVRV